MVSGTKFLVYVCLNRLPWKSNSLQVTGVTSRLRSHYEPLEISQVPSPHLIVKKKRVIGPFWRSFLADFHLLISEAASCFSSLLIWFPDTPSGGFVPWALQSFEENVAEACYSCPHIFPCWLPETHCGSLSRSLPPGCLLHAPKNSEYWTSSAGFVVVIPESLYDRLRNSRCD